MRKMMRNYRPDHMRMEDYRWRYCRITKTDVPYTSNAGGAREMYAKKYGLSHMQSFFTVGGICGPRAFAGRMATHAFGIPSRPAPQTGQLNLSATSQTKEQKMLKRLIHILFGRREKWLEVA